MPQSLIGKRRKGKTLQNKQGFTLAEVVVVIGVVALLAGIMVPLISQNLEAAKRARAKNEIKIFGAALGSFYKDTGYWPFFSDGSSLSNSFSLLRTEKGRTPTDIKSGEKWLQGNRDTFDNQMIYNKPGGSNTHGYPLDGEFAWRGPYLPEIKPDPWGMTYLARKGQSGISVLSSGPNKAIETMPSSVEAQGDDILFKIVAPTGRMGPMNTSKGNAPVDASKFTFDTHPDQLGPLKPGAPAGVSITGIYQPGSTKNVLDGIQELKTRSGHEYFEHRKYGKSGYNYIDGNNVFKKAGINAWLQTGSVVTFSNGTTGIIDRLYNSSTENLSVIYYKAYDLTKKPPKKQ